MIFFPLIVLQDNPDLEGTIELLFDVNDKGIVTYVNMGKSTIGDPVFIEEVLTAVSNHEFDVWGKGKEKTEVVYPLTFLKKDTVEEEEEAQ